MLMNKYNEFLSLVNDVSQCHLCEQICTLPHTGCGEYLENDNHGIDLDIPYVNLWNLWHGNLDADIMVIGQDFGQKEESYIFLENQKSKNYNNPTDIALRELFKATFDIDIDDENASLFFTNMANCYRKHKTTGAMHSGWLPICAHKYMGRLIKIIRPKIIIVLGQSAFDAMFCLDGLKVQCINPDKTIKGTFGEIICHQYRLQIDNSFIDVFPVYHPGANSNRNRSFEEQKQDWNKISKHYKRVK